MAKVTKKTVGRMLQTGEVSVVLPLAPVNLQAYIPLHAEVRFTRDQGIALKQVYTALNDAGARMDNKRYVQSYADALRYVMEQVAKAAPINP